MAFGDTIKAGQKPGCTEGKADSSGYVVCFVELERGFVSLDSPGISWKGFNQCVDLGWIILNYVFRDELVQLFMLSALNQ